MKNTSQSHNGYNIHKSGFSEEYKPRILLVDDEPLILQIYCGIFQSDFETKAVESGKEALETVHDFKPDIIVLDAIMPDMDGWTVCRTIKSDTQTASIKIIMASAKATGKDDRLAGYAAGTDDYIIKPFIHEDLFAKVQVLLRLKRIEDYLKTEKNALEKKVREHTTELIKKEISLQKEIKNRIKEETEKNKLEEKLRHAQRMEAVGFLVSGISHNFNNIISSISGYAEMLKSEDLPEEKKLKFLDGIEIASRRAHMLVKQLNQFAGKKEYRFETIDTHSLINETILLLEHTLGHSIQIDKSLNAAQPKFKGDFAQIQNVLLNLAINARDAMPEGGTITVKTENIEFDNKSVKEIPEIPNPGPYLMMNISDTGIGMSEEVQSMIFQPFFTTKKEKQGTGLGLSSAYESITKHNGFIQVSSKPGKGTDFYIYLPVFV